MTSNLVYSEDYPEWIYIPWYAKLRPSVRNMNCPQPLCDCDGTFPCHKAKSFSLGNIVKQSFSSGAWFGRCKLMFQYGGKGKENRRCSSQEAQNSREFTCVTSVQFYSPSGGWASQPTLSPEIISLGKALLTYPSWPIQFHSYQRGRASFPVSCTWGWFICAHTITASSTVIAREVSRLLS